MNTSEKKTDENYNINLNGFLELNLNKTLKLNKKSLQLHFFQNILSI